MIVFLILALATCLMLSVLTLPFYLVIIPFLVYYMPWFDFFFFAFNNVIWSHSTFSYIVAVQSLSLV